MHAYGPKSAPIAQGLVEDINAMHTYGRSSAPIAQGLVYDIKKTPCLLAVRIPAYLRVSINTHSPRAGGDHERKREKNGDVSKSPRACEQHT